ncbi:MAG: penicillin-binding protein 2 [Verrucomicrobiales bacterium]|nr:penicillin-binding protein 2 [Verrucomicrobiales bacterium]
MVVKYRLRLYLLSLLMLGAFSLLTYRLWELQIERHAEFVKKIRVGSELKARIPGVRGEIKDRNGITLATNRAIFEVRINLEEMMKEYNRRVQRGEMAEVAKVTVNFTDRGMQRQRNEEDVVKIFKEVILPRLEEMGLVKNFKGEAMQIHYRTFKGVVPWVYRDDLTFAEFSRFAEHNLALPGVTVAERGVREYPWASLACHLLGYVRLAEDQRVSSEERAEWDYFLPDDYGGAGVEKSFDDYLRGKPGVRTMKKDERGRLVGEVSYQEPRKGNDVYLTIDARIQYIAERALREGGVGRGAAVVVDPYSGEVLALASVPSYDPNRFIPKISTAEYAEYLDNPANPLFNRAVKPYAPGSTFKIPIAFAGCLADIQMRHFNCAGGVTYGNNYMKCWIADKGGSHGSLDVSDAIMRSCNCFFYQYGNAAGINNITRVGQLLGVGEKTGIELEDEDPGVLPNPSWLRLNHPKERWSSGYTANTSIGQGMVLATPLQMASVVATVANRGMSYRPHLLKQVKDGDELVLDNPPDLRSNLGEEGLNPQEIEMIRKGMWKVVNASGGTAKAAKIDGIEVAGKTGTAQFWRMDKGVKKKDNHTWFITFAPYETPKLAICVLVQGGKSGGGCAGPVAKRIMEQSLALDNGYQVALAPVEESKGHMNQIEAVSYEDGPLLLAATDDDPDLGGPVREAMDDVIDARPVASPTLRDEADAAGSVETDAPRNIPKAIPVQSARRAPMFDGDAAESPSSQEESGKKPERRPSLLRRIFR